MSSFDTLVIGNPRIGYDHCNEYHITELYNSISRLQSGGITTLIIVGSVLTNPKVTNPFQLRNFTNFIDSLVLRLNGSSETLEEIIFVFGKKDGEVLTYLINSYEPEKCLIKTGSDSEAVSYLRPNSFGFIGHKVNTSFLDFDVFHRFVGGTPKDMGETKAAVTYAVEDIPDTVKIPPLFPYTYEDTECGYILVDSKTDKYKVVHFDVASPFVTINIENNKVDGMPGIKYIQAHKAELKKAKEISIYADATTTSSNLEKFKGVLATVNSNFNLIDLTPKDEDITINVDSSPLDVLLSVLPEDDDEVQDLAKEIFKEAVSASNI